MFEVVRFKSNWTVFAWHAIIYTILYCVVNRWSYGAELFISCLWQPYDGSPRTVKVHVIYEVLGTHMFIFLSLRTLVMKLGMSIPRQFLFLGDLGNQGLAFFQSLRFGESRPYSSRTSRNFQWVRSLKIKYLL